jgi:hypothetical protein
MAYNCDNHPDNAGALLMTTLATGDTAVLCGECIFPWALAIANALTVDGTTVEVVAAATPGPDDPSDDPDGQPIPYLPTDQPGQDDDQGDDHDQPTFDPDADPIGAPHDDPTPEPLPSGDAGKVTADA